MILKKILIGISTAMFVVLLIILALNILNRFIPMTSFHWLDEIVELCFASMVFYGASAVWIDKAHFSAGDWIQRLVKNPLAAALYSLTLEIAGIVFFAVLFWFSAKLALAAADVTAVFQIPKKIVYACMPISALIMLVVSLARAGGAILSLLRKPKIGV